MAGSLSYSIFSLGDAAATIDIGNGNCIDEQKNIRALALHDWLQAQRFRGILDIIVAYSSVSVFYDPAVVQPDIPEEGMSVFSCIRNWLERAWQQTEKKSAPVPAPRFIRLPVCYEAAYAPDLEWVARQTSLSGEEVIRIHCADTYRVYMIGFLPGFSYIGLSG